MYINSSRSARVLSVYNSLCSTPRNKLRPCHLPHTTHRTIYRRGPLLQRSQGRRNLVVVPGRCWSVDALWLLLFLGIVSFGWWGLGIVVLRETSSVRICGICLLGLRQRLVVAWIRRLLVDAGAGSSTTVAVAGGVDHDFHAAVHALDCFSVGPCGRGIGLYGKVSVVCWWRCVCCACDLRRDGSYLRGSTCDLRRDCFVLSGVWIWSRHLFRR